MSSLTLTDSQPLISLADVPEGHRDRKEEEEISWNDFIKKWYLGHLTVIVVGLGEVKARDSNIIHHSALFNGHVDIICINQGF